MTDSQGVVFISTACLAGQGSLSARLAALTKAGASHIELSGASASFEEAIAATAPYLGRVHFLIHNYFPRPKREFVLNIASRDPKVRAQCRDLMLSARDLCLRLGAPMYSVHAGFCVDPPAEALGRPWPRHGALPPPEALAAQREFLAALLPEFTDAGLTLLVENNVLAPFNLVGGENTLLLGVTGQGLACCLASLSPARGVGALFDTGHMKVSCATLGLDAAQEFGALRGLVKAFQIHDNDGFSDQHRRFGAGAWFAPLLRALPLAWHIIESHHESASEAVAQAGIVRGFFDIAAHPPSRQ